MTSCAYCHQPISPDARQRHDLASGLSWHTRCYVRQELAPKPPGVRAVSPLPAPPGGGHPKGGGR